MRSPQTKPYVLDNGEGQYLQPLGTLATIKATTEQTGGLFNLLEVTCPPKYTTLLHIHYTEDVAVFVLEGMLTFFLGTEQKQVAAGSFFYQPQGTPHGFRVQGCEPARILYMTIPAGFDHFLIEQEHLGQNPEHGEEAAARYKIEILGPLPE